MTRNKPIRTKPIPWCPECGAPMILVIPKPDADWDTFWGCTRYNDVKAGRCKGSRNILSNGLPDGDTEEYIMTCGQWTGNDLKRQKDSRGL